MPFHAFMSSVSPLFAHVIWISFLIDKGVNFYTHYAPNYTRNVLIKHCI